MFNVYNKPSPSIFPFSSQRYISSISRGSSSSLSRCCRFGGCNPNKPPWHWLNIRIGSVVTSNSPRSDPWWKMCTCGRVREGRERGREGMKSHLSSWSYELIRIRGWDSEAPCSMSSQFFWNRKLVSFVSSTPYILHNFGRGRVEERARERRANSKALSETTPTFTFYCLSYVVPHTSAGNQGVNMSNAKRMCIA